MNLQTVKTILTEKNSYSKGTILSYTKSLGIALNALQTENVFDVYNRITEFYRLYSHKERNYVLNIFRHLKSIYDNLPEEYKLSIDSKNYEILKNYAKAGYKPSLSPDVESDESVESIADSIHDYKVCNIDTINDAKKHSVPTRVDEDLNQHKYDQLESSLQSLFDNVQFIKDIVMIMVDNQDLATTREIQRYLIDRRSS